jgi:hypothetical protein
VTPKTSAVNVPTVVIGAPVFSSGGEFHRRQAGDAPKLRRLHRPALLRCFTPKQVGQATKLLQFLTLPWAGGVPEMVVFRDTSAAHESYATFAIGTIRII